MVQVIRILTTISCLACLLACKPKKEFPQNDPHDQIHFGQGGGFTGMVTYFILLEDGRLFQRGLQDSSYTLMDTWKQGFTTQLFSSYASLQFDQVQHNEPGDLYYFIEYRRKNAPPHRIVWGRPGHPPGENISRYYNLLFKSTKSKS